MSIDYDRAAAILDEYRGLEAHEVYYHKDRLRCQRMAPLGPDLETVLRKAFLVSPKVLDVGCGRGKTLLDNAHLFQWGAGLDESDRHMIAPARADRDARGIRNVEFYVGKAATLPFENDTFDLVFSERGPLGHSDHNLVEALRVLRKGGLLLIETGWCYETLLQERERFVRLGIDVQLGVFRKELLQFPDRYELLRSRCIERRYMDKDPLPAADDHAGIDKMLDGATTNGQGVGVWREVIWVGGAKKGGNP